MVKWDEATCRSNEIKDSSSYKVFVSVDRWEKYCVSTYSVHLPNQSLGCTLENV